MVPPYMVRRHRALAFAVLAGVAPVAFPLVAQEPGQTPPASMVEQMRELLSEASVLRDQLKVLGEKLKALINRIEAEIIKEEEPPAPPVTTADSGEATTAFQQATARSSTPRGTSAASMAPPSPESDVSSVRQQFAWAERSPATHAQERQAYLDALAYLERAGPDGDYRRFRTMLQRFVETYRGGVYEPSARYLIADSYYTENQYERAAQGFLRYIEHFPRGDHVGDARLKLAHIRYEQGGVAVAVRLLKQLSDSGDERIRELAQRKLRLIAKDASE